MRDRTRSYTTDLPRIGLPFLANMRSRLADAEPGTQLYTQTESGTLYTSRQADSYAMTINGVTRAIRTTTTQGVIERDRLLRQFAFAANIASRPHQAINYHREGVVKSLQP